MISTNIQLAAKILKDEGIIGLPTETVYGLAGNIFSEKAINKIFEIKQRPLYNPLIVHIKNIEDLSTIAVEIPPIAIEIAQKFWPGPITLLLKKSALVPDLVTSGKSTVAVRMPNHSTALALLNTLDFPLAAPSANPFGRISPTKAAHVADYFGESVEMILDGGVCKTGVESTIIGFNGNEVIVYRLGGVAIEEIMKLSTNVTLFNRNDASPEAPGMLSKHYAPSTPLILTDNLRESLVQYENKRIGLLLFSKTIDEAPKHSIQKVLSANAKLEEAAAQLYETLHQLDKMQLEIIIAEQCPEEGFGRVINDKLSRAAQNRY